MVDEFGRLGLDFVVPKGTQRGSMGLAGGHFAEVFVGGKVGVAHTLKVDMPLGIDVAVAKVPLIPRLNNVLAD